MLNNVMFELIGCLVGKEIFFLENSFSLYLPFLLFGLLRVNLGRKNGFLPCSKCFPPKLKEKLCLFYLSFLTYLFSFIFFCSFPINQSTKQRKTRFLLYFWKMSLHRNYFSWNYFSFQLNTRVIMIGELKSTMKKTKTIRFGSRDLKLLEKGRNRGA